MFRQFIAAAAMFACSTAFADSEIMCISLNNGSEAEYNVADIKEIYFKDADSDLVSGYEGTFTGKAQLIVGGSFTYETELTIDFVADENRETLTVLFPEYSLEGTMMGNITLGALTLTVLEFDESKGGFYRNYGGEGITRHFKAVNNGTTTMDSDYVLNDPSDILITLGEDGSISVTDSFKLGAMPMPLQFKFIGYRK